MPDFSGQDSAFMRRALELGAQGEGRVAPNPPVGCVIVKNGAIAAEGWHDRYGGLHAEAMALSRLQPGEAESAVAYVTLAPCISYGKQPPCADALAAAGVKEVVIAVCDPNPQNQASLERLKNLGLGFRTGLLEEEARYLARGFFSRFRQNRPYVTLKYAMTLDGKIAAASGDSRWVSGPESREIVQDLRSRNDAVLVGIGTALADDPLLTVRNPVLARRSENGPHPQPLRVIADSHARLSPTAALFGNSPEPGGKVLVATLDGNAAARAAKLSAAGAEVVMTPERDGRICLKDLLALLLKRGVNNVLCEGGAAVAASLLAEEIVDEVIVFVAPKIVGGTQAPGPVGDLGIMRMADARKLRFKDVRSVAGDIMVRAEIA